MSAPIDVLILKSQIASILGDSISAAQDVRAADKGDYWKGREEALVEFERRQKGLFLRAGVELADAPGELLYFVREAEGNFVNVYKDEASLKLTPGDTVWALTKTLTLNDISDRYPADKVVAPAPAPAPAASTGAIGVDPAVSVDPAPAAPAEPTQVETPAQNATQSTPEDIQ